MDISSLKSLNTVATIGLTVISPVHIDAAGEKLWIENIDFFYDGETQEVVVLDQHRLMRALLYAETDKGESGLAAYQNRLASGRYWSMPEFLEECDISVEEVKKFRWKLLHAPANEIRPLIRTGRDMPIIPGSSIKGALRSIIFHHLVPSDTRADRDLERKLFGHIDQDMMKFIRPYDAEGLETGIINCDLYNLYQDHGNWLSDYKDGFYLTVEAFLPGAKTEFRLSVADGLVAVLEEAGLLYSRYLVPKAINKVVDRQEPIRHLFRLINDYTRTHLEREIVFFEKYPQAEDIEYVIGNLNAYLDMTHAADSCMLRLAYGSGFHGITGDWRFSDHTTTIQHPDLGNRTWNASSRSMEPARYKSRKVVGRDRETTLMGFVQLNLQ